MQHCQYLQVVHAVEDHFGNLGSWLCLHSIFHLLQYDMIVMSATPSGIVLICGFEVPELLWSCIAVWCMYSEIQGSRL